MSSLLDSQPVATQPATYHAEDDDTDEEEEDGEPKAWGRLFPLTPDFDTVELSGEKYVLGRHPECDVVFDDPVISNRHCVLTREKPDGASQGGDEDYTVFVEDKSSNGTYVNNERLGKGNKIALKHGDELSLTLKKKSAPSFVFHDCVNTETTSGDSALKEKYNLMKPLGSGACGEVWLAVCKSSGHKYAVKIIQKKRFNSVSGASVNNDQLLQEVEILRKLDHPNIVAICEIFDTPETLSIVLELVQGGELFDRIVDKTKFTEQETKFFFRQLFLSVKYLHEQGVAHRDLKPENVLLSSHDMDAVIKVTDFGLAKLVGPQSFMKTMCGTPSYQAPEVLLAGMGKAYVDGYNNAVDIWSLGVILYICLFGYPPFAEDIPNVKLSLAEQITRGQFEFPADQPVSPEVEDLIRHMLEVNPINRISITSALAHPWMQDEEIIQKVDDLLEKQNAVKKRKLAAFAQDRQLSTKRPADVIAGGDKKRQKLSS